VVIDLDDPSIAGATAEDLMAQVVFSMERTALVETRVAGEALKLDFSSARPAFEAAMRRLWS
jgi:hypothetical protein